MYSVHFFKNQEPNTNPRIVTYFLEVAYLYFFLNEDDKFFEAIFYPCGGKTIFNH